MSPEDHRQDHRGGEQGGSSARLVKLRIVSGAQTGVDRAALDSALRHGIDCGGWCPEGRQAEDGPIPAAYPVIELAGCGYSERTLKNVQDSDGTVIIYFGTLSGGTEKTLRFCLDEGRPYLLLDATEIASSRAAERIVEFYRQLEGERLNFAGPRASGEAAAYGYTREAVDGFLHLIGDISAPVQEER